ncbi:sialate O-acetylesterase-like [Xenia sp. Carnegie-2017]|uniref:sialate O-acetylesterase-like n=1 Tax=Xenia sp. Carnegie-2017 TaxID=2897299 RepID=UPI001F03F796|nr:sialate O-acetylesterase-like [Xenia sp. Carnegie-2017]
MQNTFALVRCFTRVQLYKILNYRIGLIASSFEGSPIESWSSHDALKQCEWIGEFLKTLPNSGINELSTFPLYSCMWNSMIVPFLNMTIYGSIFYQGETNAMNPKLLELPYNCTFPAMINDWRAKWYASTQNNTDPQFPFGFVQLSAVNYSNSSLHFAQLRWDQTAQKGYAPNAQLQNTFIAVTIDLGNPSSPYTSIHHTHKSDVEYRLALSGLSLVYGKERYFTGPLVSKIEKIAVESNMFLIINYKSVDKNIEIRNKIGFEVLCKGRWIQSPIAYNCSKSVFISVRCDPDKVRYAWSDNPCEKLKCAVYSGGLPSPPFIMDGPFSSEKKSLNGCHTA